MAELADGTPAAPNPGTVALRALEMDPAVPRLDRAPSACEELSDGGVPRRLGVSRPRCAPVVALRGDRAVALDGEPVMMPERVAVADGVALRGDAALDELMEPERHGALEEREDAVPDAAGAEKREREKEPEGEAGERGEPPEEPIPCDGVMEPRGVPALELDLPVPREEGELLYVERLETPLLGAVEPVPPVEPPRGATAGDCRGAADPEDSLPDERPAEGAEYRGVDPVLGVDL